MKEPGIEEVRLIQKELNIMRDSWNILRGLVRSGKEGRRKQLQDLLRKVRSIEKMIGLCLDGRAPYILREREVQRRREREWNKAEGRI